MERIRDAIKRRRSSVSYEPLDNGGNDDCQKEQDVPFSWLEYTIFMLLGVSMLWAW